MTRTIDMVAFTPEALDDYIEARVEQRVADDKSRVSNTYMVAAAGGLALAIVGVFAGTEVGQSRGWSDGFRTGKAQGIEQGAKQGFTDASRQIQARTREDFSNYILRPSLDVSGDDARFSRQYVVPNTLALRK